jgi:predicted HD superfamily hydrolase involved in NAD metabolism
MQGIPDKISLDFVKEWVQPRVSDKRLMHIKGVASVARKIAQVYGCDEDLAEFGGWLHDACKEFKPPVLVEKARELGINVLPLEAQQGHLLHGPVAAKVASTELGITNEDLLAAIAEHTLGNVPMCKLSEVLFLADCLEESRPRDYTGPIWTALAIDGELNVPKAMLVATELGLQHLLETGRPIHPLTIDVRNHYLETVKRQGA